MLDLQAVYVRDVAEIIDIDVVTVASLSGENTSAVEEVRLNGHATQFLPLGLDEMLIHFPPELLFEQVTSVSLVRSSGTARYTENVGVARLKKDAAVLSVTGHDFSNVAEVRVNNKSMPYAQVSTTKILVDIPDHDKSLDSVQVIKTQAAIGKESFFSFLLGKHPRLISGLHKLVFQYVKVLLTTPNRDILRPDVGGNMQNWAGQRVSSSNPQALVSKAVLAATRSAAHMIGYQASSSLPADEKLATVQVLSANLDPTDPTRVSLSLKIINQAQQVTVFGVSLGNADELAQK